MLEINATSGLINITTHKDHSGYDDLYQVSAQTERKLQSDRSRSRSNEKV